MILWHTVLLIRKIGKIGSNHHHRRRIFIRNDSFRCSRRRCRGRRIAVPQSHLAISIKYSENQKSYFTTSSLSLLLVFSLSSFNLMHTAETYICKKYYHFPLFVFVCDFCLLFSDLYDEWLAFFEVMNLKTKRIHLIKHHSSGTTRSCESLT